MAVIEIYANRFYPITFDTTYFDISLSPEGINDSVVEGSSSGTKSWLAVLSGPTGCGVAWWLMNKVNTTTDYFVVGSSFKVGCTFRMLAKSQFAIAYQVMDRTLWKDVSWMYVRSGYMSILAEYNNYTYLYNGKTVDGTLTSLGSTTLSGLSTNWWTIEVLREGASTVVKFFRWQGTPLTKTLYTTFNITDSTYSSGNVAFLYSQHVGTVSNLETGNIDYFWIEG